MKGKYGKTIEKWSPKDRYGILEDPKNKLYNLDKAKNKFNNLNVSIKCTKNWTLWGASLESSLLNMECEMIFIQYKALSETRIKIRSVYLLNKSETQKLIVN